MMYNVSKYAKRRFELCEMSEISKHPYASLSVFHEKLIGS